MGQARKRGTYAKRKQQAIEAGQAKKMTMVFEITGKSGEPKCKVRWDMTPKLTGRGKIWNDDSGVAVFGAKIIEMFKTEGLGQ